MKPVENWVSVSGYKGHYEVSDQGRVKSYKRYRQGKVLKPFPVGNGYLTVRLRIDGRKKNHLVHRLVAMAFVPNPDEHETVHHDDVDIKNNCADNLVWIPREDNTSEARSRALETDEVPF